MIAAVIEIIKLALGFIKERSQAKHDVKMAYLLDKKRQLDDHNTQTYNWDMSQLNNKNRVIRILAFLAFFSPWLGYAISPEVGNWVERGWTSVPQWQANAFSGLCLAIFGMQHIHNFIGGTVDAVAKSFKK